MAGALPPPGELDLKASDLASGWRRWRRTFENYLVALGVVGNDAPDEARKVAVFLHCAGEDAREAYGQFHFTGEEGDKSKVMKDVLRKFENYCNPRTNSIYNRRRFFEAKQNEGEQFDMFLLRVRRYAEACDFGDQLDYNVRDRILFGMIDDKLADRLMEKSDDELTVDNVIKWCRLAELSKINRGVEGLQVEEAAVGRRGRQNTRPKTRKPGDKCQKCGNNEHTGNATCPAKDAFCHKCNKKGHFKRCCWSKEVKEVNEVENNESGDFFIAAVGAGANGNPWCVDLMISGSRVKFKIDSGADVTVMNLKTYQSLDSPPKLFPTRVNLNSVGGPINCKGTFLTQTTVKGVVYRFRVFVVNTVSNLLSRQLSEAMNLVKLTINELRHSKKQLDQKKELGCMKGSDVKIRLKSHAEPVKVTTARRIPIPLVEAVNEELQRMLDKGIIEKVTEPTDWCAPIVVVPKEGGQTCKKVRICVDLRGLNRAVERENYTLPTIDDVIAKLDGGTVFSTLDAASGYYQMRLDKDSQKLTTFIAPKGRYCFRRVPFGISSASEIFQSKINEFIEGIEGAIAYQDDVIITGRTKQEHDARLSQVLERLDANGVELNKEKCHFGVTRIKFLGHVFSSRGMEVDEGKVNAISNMEAPHDTAALRTVIGMVQYLGRFIPKLAEIMKPMSDLLKRDATWMWGPDQEMAFNKIKQLLVEAPTLAFFSPDRETIVSADASNYGIGGMISQTGPDGVLHAVAYASRVLTAAESKYSQIEKECLACVWICEKFDRYLRGLDGFSLMTDHKPLVPLFNGCDLNTVPIRCQRLLMRMMRYNPVAEHVPGKQLVVADCLSRCPIEDDASHAMEEVAQVVETYLEEILLSIPIGTNRMDQIRQETAKDTRLCRAIEYTLHGWPKYIHEVPEDLLGYYHSRAHLSVAKGLLLHGTRVVVPPSLRDEILDIIHHGHLGAEKCKERAKTAVWWPQMPGEIQQKVAACEYCQQKRPAQCKEPMIQTPLPEGPWKVVGTDLLSYKGGSYLVITDYYSRFPELVFLPDTTSNTVIGKMKAVFARWGIPEKVVSDNGPQYSSAAFQEFALTYGFEHVTSSPGYPQSNGLAERSVGIMKDILSQDDPLLALMVYRATPVQATGVSPVELMIGRPIRNTLPCSPRNLVPSHRTQEDVYSRDKKYKEHAERHYNRQAKSLPPLVPGDMVRMREGNEWGEPLTVIAEADTPRSYRVQRPNGSEYRRNRRHLQLVPERKNGNDYNDIADDGQEHNPISQEQNHSPNIQQPMYSRSGRAITKPTRLIENM